MRFLATIIFLCLGIVFCGCSGVGYLTGGSQKDSAGNRMSTSELKAEILKLEAANHELKKQMDIDQETMQRFRAESGKKLVLISERNRLLTKEMNKLKRDNQKIITENETLKKKLARIEAKDALAGGREHKALKNTGRLKIKVLSGNGDLDSAKRVAERLRKMGYTIEVIHFAPRSNFQKTTIYFAPRYQHEAERLRSKVGRYCRLKPLDWPSAFDLILVTGIQ